MENMKYKIEKLDGTPVDPAADYLVLRLDGPEHVVERLCAQVYTLGFDAPSFFNTNTEWTDIQKFISELQGKLQYYANQYNDEGSWSFLGKERILTMHIPKGSNDSTVKCGNGVLTTTNRGESK